MPYPQDGLNDIPAIVARRESPDQFADATNLRRTSELYRLGGGAGPFWSPARHGHRAAPVHHRFIAQPHRLGHLRRALQHISRPLPGVWLTTPGAVAAHFAATQPADAE